MMELLGILGRGVGNGQWKVLGLVRDSGGGCWGGGGRTLLVGGSHDKESPGWTGEKERPVGEPEGLCWSPLGQWPCLGLANQALPSQLAAPSRRRVTQLCPASTARLSMMTSSGSKCGSTLAPGPPQTCPTVSLISITPVFPSRPSLVSPRVSCSFWDLKILRRSDMGS